MTASGGSRPQYPVSAVPGQRAPSPAPGPSPAASIGRSDALEGKTVLVTGGTGSLGQVLVRRLLSGEAGMPRKVIVLSRDEAKQHAMRQEYLHRAVTTDESIYRNFERTLELRLGDVRDYRDVLACVTDADVVVNAAALKQVPVCEYFPDQAVRTNCIGAENIARAVRERGYQVECVVGVSTDKAAKPVNVMGMTKAIQERILIGANVGAKAMGGRTRFVVVRYGNVLASRGSVIPLFHDQIARGGPVTVTVAAMTRFLVTLDDAVDMILRAIRIGRPGEILVPITPAALVINIAKALIGDRPIPITFTGIRPGEKMHEVLVSDEESHWSRREDRYQIISPMLPELAEPGIALGGDLKGEYSSAHGVVDLPTTVELLRDNRLLPEQVDRADRVELLR
jgi:UDP-glucose 4-epimerase